MRGVVDYRLLTNIYATNNLAGIVISVKILGLKFLRYIAGITGFELMISYRNHKDLMVSIVVAKFLIHIGKIQVFMRETLRES